MTVWEHLPVVRETESNGALWLQAGCPDCDWVGDEHVGYYGLLAAQQEAIEHRQNAQKRSLEP